jgi:hypothetical protein
MSNVPPSPGQPAGAPPPKKSGWVKWLVLGCLAIAVVLVLIFGGIFWGVSKATAEPEKAVREFLAAAAAGDHAAAHNYFSAPLKQAQPYDDFVAMAQANPQLFQIASTSFSNRSVDTTGAALSGTVTLTSGSKLPASFKLIKENDQWRLISYNIGS